ncbi:MAG: DNA repair protein RecN [Acidobacteriota bacterium]|jgi:DNA repair protein RecN (Recombination protein N)|nr:DNA repair protein RecN [Acidobacteriota bacterium]
MLRLLRIRNLALIRELEVEFGRGLNLLTGETGSGKSILVDALGLALGARASQEMIRTDCDSAVLEGMFEVGASSPAATLLAEAGFAPEDAGASAVELVVRREIASNGRNRVFVNDRLSTLSFLKSLGERLADIHGQQEQQSLLDLGTHRGWLDEFGGNRALAQDVRARFRLVRETARRLDEIEGGEQERLRRIDNLRFQVGEIEKVAPRPGEKEDLERERDFLANRERILALSTEAYALLYESEASVLGKLNHVAKVCRELGEFDADWNARAEALADCRYKLEDVAYAARDYADGGDFSPARLEAVHQRLDAIERLIRKYGASCEEVVAYGGRCAAELDGLLDAGDSTERLAERFGEELKSYEAAARRLSEKRREDACRLEGAIRGEFAALAMGRMELHVKFHAPGDARAKAATGRLPAGYGPDGMDTVEFLIAPNQGEEMRPLAKIASGGELSRLMLAVKSLCGGAEGGGADMTLVFDEVDAGVGGRVAEAVGKRLAGIAEGNQVLCVTHLPQVAAFARRHYNVRKEVVGERTETFVTPLDAKGQEEEVARMLGGETITDAARRVAAEMLERSQASARKKRARS